MHAIHYYCWQTTDLVTFCYSCRVKKFNCIRYEYLLLAMHCHKPLGNADVIL
jgi:hypothetical protein